MSPPDQDTIVLFGPQVTTWTQESLSSLQYALLLEPHLKFLKETLAELPSLWPSLEKKLDLRTFPGHDSLLQLNDFATGKKIPDEKSLRNVHLAPLTIVDQIVQYILPMAERTDEALELPAFQMAAQGFCIGFLSAAAISTSSSWTELELNASNAVRLAACMGAVIDNEDASHHGATAVSVRWKTDSDRTYLESSLDLFPDAYVSCITDEKTVTITVPCRDEISFCSRLSQVGIATSHIGLNGCFHSSRHASSAHLLKELCAEDQLLQLPAAETLCFPVRSTADGEIICTGSLHDIAIDLILCKRAHWFQTVQATLAAERSGGRRIETLAVGKGSFVPRSLSSTKVNLKPHQAEEIAVVGMACRFPQADSLEEFWQLISSGGTALGRIPVERFNPARIHRDPKLLDFWGNFLKSPEVFDHRFFGISGREAKSMDPQQRLALQVAYEALESAGYYSLPSEKQATDIGCYLGVGAVDYEENVASENANAFSATGTLRAFISGRVSHYFGWSGPSVTFDTACSSSAVAIHSACKALLAGECSIALAGGVNVITSPHLYQNLMAGNFLNPTGSSKAFDASANGYCRGEGAGLLLLKPLSSAVANGDFVLGLISGSAVNQGSNCSSITVPDSNSQSNLYKQALSSGGIQPNDVTFVEAHGTGTPVGDPIEYESVRSTFNGSERREELFIGSVKDNIGHAEAASGVAGVIKTLLMMQHGAIPKQANFMSLNPRIKSSPSDRMIVPKETRPWTASRRIALVNNYGAAGSNAAIVLREHNEPSKSRHTSKRAYLQSSSATYPILLSARSASSLRYYTSALKSYVPKDEKSLSSLAYNISQRQNPSFEYRAAFTISDRADLVSKLEESPSITKRCREDPVVLCFGGQTGRIVNLSRQIYDDCVLLRRYLSECDVACQDLGLASIFPGIFQEEPVNNLVSLHCMLFSLQWSSARCWLDSGLKVDTLIGHSFGHLTALCIAGSIFHKDALRLISGRARLVQEEWGQEPGVMLSVECDRKDIEALVGLINSQNGFQVEFACYNGPRTFVLAGDTSSIEKVEDACRSPDSSRRFKVIRLINSHAYHSHLTDGILPGLERLAKSIGIRNPSITLETCSRYGNRLRPTTEDVVKHTRQPVYFFNAVERITARLPSAIWLEAGSATPIISMTRRILNSRLDSNLLIAMDLGPRDTIKSLANAATQLWMAGLKVHYWLFQQSQKSKFTRCDLPPYQFEKAQHWIQYKPSIETKPIESTRSSNASESDLVSLMKHDMSGEAVFSVDTSNTIYQLAARGHAVAGQSLCPASMYIELAARCAGKILGDISGRLPEVEELIMSAPLGLSVDVKVLLRLTKTVEGEWNFVVLSESQRGHGNTEHAKGRIRLTPVDDSLLVSQMKLLTQLARSSRPKEILASPLATGISGSMVYKVFSDVVKYATYYRGVSSLSGLNNEVVGLVTVPGDGKAGLDPGVCDPTALDNFLQVAGIHVNCLSDRKGNEVFMCIAVEKVVFSQIFMKNRLNTRSWTVYSRYEKSGNKNITNNIFIFDTDSNTLVLSIIGAIFRSVPFNSVVKSLAKLNAINGTTSEEKITSSPADSAYISGSPSSPAEEDEKQFNLEDNSPQLLRPLPGGFQASRVGNSSKSSQLIQDVREMFAEIIEIPLDEVKTTSTLDDLGIDSLLVTEVQGEIQKRFNVNITPADFSRLDNVLSVCRQISPDSFENPRKLDNEEVKDRSQSVVFNGSAPEPRDITGCENRVENSLAVVGHDSFSKVKDTYDQHAETTGFCNFRTQAFPLQSELVVQYVVEAFVSLGCNLSALKTGDKVPTVPHIPIHDKIIPQLYRILQAAGLIKEENGTFSRTTLAMPQSSSSVLHTAMLKKFPQHTSETNLLHATGHRLADCLSGTADPVGLIFRDSVARALLSDVYLNAPMFKAGTMLLAHYLAEVLESVDDQREIKILELGAGTGGTTSYLLETLARSKNMFQYTFTDLSSSLVMAAKRKFAKYPFMQYSVLDIEKNPEPQFLGAYDIIISTNCIHATKDLVLSTTNIRKMLRPDGILCLVELTRNLFWFDLVFGLLEGWWLFNDGRKHVLADEVRWERCLHAAGFQWVDWSDSPSEVSDILRVITASPFKVITPSEHGSDARNNNPQVQETVVFKEVDGLELRADLYYPSEIAESSKKIPVALMIHGGGHIMLSRKDIRPEQTTMLLRSGFLPISVDYRLCPETTIREGPMVDVVDALAWIRNVLPKLHLKRQDVLVDGEKVVSVGWSTGGTLAMSLAWTSISQGVRPPDAILAFYCPMDYEDPFWITPNIPAGSEDQLSSCKLNDDTWAGVYDQPITKYNVPPTKRALGGWLAPSDARSRLALYMNWHGRTVHVLLNGLDKRRRKESEQILDGVQGVLPGDVAAISPLAHIRSGTYATPTFIIHPRQDDLIPWQQAERVWKALRVQGVDTELRILEDVPHLFDVYREYGSNEAARTVVREGYSFLCKYAGL